MALVDKLREEIITSQQNQANLTRWKLLLIAAIGASSLGVLPNGRITERTLALLALLPLVCLYVDTLCFHSGRRVMTIAKYFRAAGRRAKDRGDTASELAEVGEYEEFCRANRHHFGLEGIALLIVSVLLSAAVSITGVGIDHRAHWLPEAFPPAASSSERWPLALLLIVSGTVGVLSCSALYVAHRLKLRELDRDDATIA